MKQPKNILDWQEVYKLPFHQDQYAPFMVWTADKKRAFDYAWPAWDGFDTDIDMSDEAKKLIIDKLNGDSSIIIEEVYNFSYDSGDIFAYCLKTQQKVHIMMIRGWGHLTGCGALNLNSEDAAKIQDDFGKWICETLNH